MLSPCSILTNNISVVATLRKMLEKQVQIKEEEGETQCTVKHKLLNLKEKAQEIRTELGDLKELVGKNGFEKLIPDEYKKYLKQEVKHRRGDSRFDDKENRQSNVDIKNYNSKSVHHASSNTSMDHHTLRSRIFKDLADLRKMEEKQKQIRDPSYQKLSSRNICTEMKRKPLQILGINETRSVNHSNSRDETFVTQESLQSHIVESVIKPIEHSNITVPALKRSDCKSLHCQNRHEYYSGDIANGVPHGKGRLFICCNKIPIKLTEGSEFYNGGFKNGYPDGYGTLTFKNGTKFVGMFQDGLRHGDGSIYYKGSVQMGKWVNGKLSNKI